MKLVECALKSFDDMQEFLDYVKSIECENIDYIFIGFDLINKDIQKYAIWIDNETPNFHTEIVFVNMP